MKCVFLRLEKKKLELYHLHEMSLNAKKKEIRGRKS